MSAGVILAMFGLLSCTSDNPVTTPEYVNQIDDWHAQRIDELKSPAGWLNIAGLYWLAEGMNSFGTAESNAVVFPPNLGIASAGYFILENGKVRQALLPGIQLTANGKLISGTMDLFNVDSVRQPVMEAGTLRWFVIKRDNRYGVRLRDLHHPNLTSFKGIDRYPVDASWKVTATWEETPNRSIPIANVLGQTIATPAPGILHFELQGQPFQLDALNEGDEELFIIFGDGTNAKETYGAGRYLYVAKPDSAGQVVIDFNKAENPPCAFTEFATCPLPPVQNVMRLDVRAGEKDYSHH